MYICERCKNECFNKFGSGKFCSRKCANSRTWTFDDKKKKSEAAKNSKLVQEALKKWKSNQKPKRSPRLKQTCPICKNGFEITQAEIQTYCSRKCAYKSPKMGGFREGSGHSKSGWFKKLFCGSTWELAFVIWAIDHDLPIKRCTEKFKYTFENKERTYFPDFQINDLIIEIKGFETLQTLAKRKQTPQVLTLFKEDLSHVFEYVKSTYGHDFIRLYEGNPHNLKTCVCQICSLPCRNIFCSKQCSMKGNRWSKHTTNLVIPAGAAPAPQG